MTKEYPILYSTDMVKAYLDDRKTMTRRPVTYKPYDYDGAYCIWKGGKAYYWGAVEKPNILEACPYGQVGDRLWGRETWAYINNYDLDGSKNYYEYKADKSNDLYPGNWPADEARGNPEAPKWRPSIHMPKRASRITQTITEVRVEWLQDITEEDCKAEGVIKYPVRIRAGRIYQALEDYTYESYPLKWGFSKGERLQADVPSLGLARFYSIDKHNGQCIHLSPKEAFSLLEDESMTYQETFMNLWDSIYAEHGYGQYINPLVWVISYPKYSEEPTRRTT